MAPTLTASKAALLKRLATKEAARRQQEQLLKVGIAPVDQGPSSVTINNVELLEKENQELEQVLKDERAKNDVEWENVRQKLASLDQIPQTDDLDRNLCKHTELALLEHEIASLSADLPNLDPPLNDFAISLVTRGILASSIEQHDTVLTSKQFELDKERLLLEQDEEIYHNLKDVRKGLETKRERLIQKADERRNDGNALRALQNRVDNVEISLERFLKSVIEISNSLYDDREADKREQLKHLIDRLINAAWDTPLNPWINVSQQYQQSVVTFLIRANIAIEHPKDARSLRLVEFHR